MTATLQIIGNGTPAPLADGACSSYLVRTGQAQLLLDCGPGSLPKLRAATSVRDLSCIILSHLHTDHFIDLLAMNVALRSAEHGRGGPITAPIPLLLPPGGLETIEACFAALSRGVTGTLAGRWRESFAAREYDPAETVTVGDLRVRFVGPTKHATTCYATRVEHEGGVLGYTGDTAYCGEAIACGREADYLLAECTLLDPGPASATHLCGEELGLVAAASGCRHLLATHIPRQDADYRAELESRIRRHYAGPLTFVDIGDRFPIPGPSPVK